MFLIACSAAQSPTPVAAPPVATPATHAWPFGVKVTGHGPPMILIPGLASPGEVWDDTVAHEQARFTCHVIELPGFGLRPAIGAPILATVRDALAAYIRAEHLERPVIVGHSLGGFLALDLAIHEPALVGKLVIVDGAPFLPASSNPAATVDSMQPVLPMIRARIANSDDATFERDQRAVLAAMITDPAQQARALAWVKRSDRAAVADTLVELMSTDLRPRLGAITAPTLVIETYRGWNVDRATAERSYAAQYAALPTAKRVMAETAKHFVMLDDPPFWFAQLDAFAP